MSSLAMGCGSRPAEAAIEMADPPISVDTV